ncbi:MAG: hypothetical protein QY311_01015 [Candidatus Paceibacterota bacterium]|nr:MAG: hypothetical protein QY311_01015 [Candidatus Paceibacterota bacterium]
MTESYRVVVDYGQSLAQMIAVGAYDYAISDINASNFPLTGNGRQEVVVETVYYDGREMTTSEVLADLESKGMRPATLPELLALGTSHPDLQYEFPIVALGSVWQHRDGGRFAPCLDRIGSERGLSLSWYDGRWDDDCRVAAVRK